MFKLDLEKAEEPEIKLPASVYQNKTKGIPKKHIYFCFIDYTKSFVLITTNWRIFQEMVILDHLTCFLRNLYVGQETTVRTAHGTVDWFQIGKEVHQGCILSLCLFNLYAEYIVQNAGLDEAQARIKVSRRNISNLRYEDDNHPYDRKQREIKEPLDEGERRE